MPTKNLSPKKKVLIVTPDLMGPIRNGGVGTICAQLAWLLASESYEVTVLFTDPRRGEVAADWNRWVNFYRKKKVKLIPLVPSTFDLEVHHWAQVSLRAYDQIKQRDDDLVVFIDMFGIGYYSLQAKALGLAFQRTKILTIFAGPMTWSRRDNHAYWSAAGELFIPMFERRAVELSDHVQIASQWSLEWCQAQKWRIPSHSQLLFPLPPPPPRRKLQKKKSVADELVFFGRLEDRKGLREFLDAVKLLSAEGRLDFSKVTFLGRIGFSHGRSAIERIAELRLRTREGKKVRIEVQPELQSQAAIDYLRKANAIACVLSRSETMGYTLIECLSNEIPVIASRIEPFEVILGKQHIEKLCPPGNVAAIATQIEHRNAIVDHQRSLDLYRKTRLDWLQLCRNLTTEEKPKRIAKSNSIINISVLIAHFNRPYYLRDALESLLRQTVMPFEILVYDDASPDETAAAVALEFKSKFKTQNCELIYHQGDRNRGPSFGRNLLVDHSKGNFLLFMDDDNRAVPNEIESLKKMQAHSAADVIVMAMQKFLDEQEELWMRKLWLPLGFDLAPSVLENGLGDTNFLIRKSKFRETGGFIDRPDFKAEDMHILLNAALKRSKMLVCPEPLVEYRVHGGNRSNERDPNERLFHASYGLNALRNDEDQEPQFSLAPITEFLVHAAQISGSQWQFQNPFWPRAVSKAEIKGSIDLLQKLPLVAKRHTWKPIGAAKQTTLDRNSNLTFDLAEYANGNSGFLDFTFTIESNTKFRCSNPYLKLPLWAGIQNIRIPVPPHLGQGEFIVKLPGIKRVYLSKLKWIPARQKETS